MHFESIREVVWLELLGNRIADLLHICAHWNLLLISDLDNLSWRALVGWLLYGMWVWSVQQTPLWNILTVRLGLIDLLSVLLSEVVLLFLKWGDVAACHSFETELLHVLDFWDTHSLNGRVLRRQVHSAFRRQDSRLLRAYLRIGALNQEFQLLQSDLTILHFGSQIVQLFFVDILITLFNLLLATWNQRMQILTIWFEFLTPWICLFYFKFKFLLYIFTMLIKQVFLLLLQESETVKHLL